MNEEKIRKLVKIVEESDIAELEISRWGVTIRIAKATANSQAHSDQVSNVAQAAAPPGPAPISAAGVEPAASVPGAGSQKEATSKSSHEGNGYVEIKSPMVGTFYRAPAPDADPYVEVNDVIKEGQVLCIIEAMKLMNEIESEFNGRIVETLVENGQPVEYNQPLFRIELS
ncbi:MAG: acetyl-CoA carboxylase biotin carboxyl carrier protein [bacterium]